MRAVSQSDASTSLPTLIKDVEREAIVIQDDGQDVAILVSPDEYRGIRSERIQRFLRSLDRAGEETRSLAAADGLSPEDLMKILDRKADVPKTR